MLSYLIINSATRVGSVYFYKNITLYNMLYIHELTLNIISIQRFIIALNCQPIFTHYFYIFFYT